MPVRAITFDFWNTLFRDANGPARQQIRIKAFSDATGVEQDRVAAVLKPVWQEFERCHVEEQRTLEPGDAVRMAAELLDVTIEPDTTQELAEVFATAILVHSPEPIEDALEAVRASAEHVPVGIISDAGVSPGRSLQTLLERNGILDYFQALSFSDEVGVAKPQRPMFETAAQALDVAPHEMLHIGDLEYSDIDGARAYGSKSALFAGHNATFAETTQADYVFHSWQECIDQLDAICGE